MATTVTTEFQVTTATTLVTTAETGVVTTTSPSTRGPSDQVALSGTVDITPGTAATSVQVRCRRGSGTGGTQVGNTITAGVTAAVVAPVSFDFLDSPGEVAGQQYTITVQQVAATGNGSVTFVAGNAQLP